MTRKPRVLLLSASSGAGHVRAAQALQKAFAWSLATVRAPYSRKLYASIGGGSPIRGQTEAQARAQGHAVKIGKFPFSANSKASIRGNHTGFVKVVADEKFGEILGVHIIGPQAYELISECVTAMEAEATVDTMINTIHAHPTIYEALGEAFNAVYGQAINA